MASRFAERAKKRKPRKLPRAARLALTPKPPAAAMLRYSLALRQLAAMFASLVRAKIKPADYARQDALEIRLDTPDGGDALSGIRVAITREARSSRLGKTITDVGKRAVAHNQGEFKRLGIRLRDSEPDLADLIKGWRESNLDRIVSLFSDEIDRLRTILEEGENRRVESLANHIEERLEVTRSKAELLARDQTLTLNAQINQHRQQAAGIEKYIWSTSNDERVRESHEEMDGEVCSWSDPPLVDDEHVHPGDPINCRCVATPILPELEESDGENAE